MGSKMEHIYKRINTFYSAVGAHPFWCAFLVCVLLTPLCFGALDNISDGAYMLVCLCYVAAPCAAVVYIMGRRGISGWRDRLAVLAAAAGLLIAGLALTKAFRGSEHRIIWIFAGIVLPALLLRGIALRDREHSDRHWAFLIMVTSFAIKLCYVLYTSFYTRQHDVGSFDGEKGHAGYIEYILKNRGLPDFDPRTRYQYYHPPLHHTVSAAWIYLCEEVFGVSRNNARESLQMLMLFYSVASLIVVYKLLRHFGFKGKALILPLALFAFHPSYILSSGSINNDQLSNLLTLVAILLTMRWCKSPTLRNIIPIALAIGFAMMSKLNAGIVAPAVAVMFLWQLVKHKEELGRFMKQFCIFGVIVFPLALWWQVKNKLMFHMPFDYVPNIGTEHQYVGDDIIGRLTDFAPKQFSSVFECFIQYGDAYDEYNPTVAILKNSLFGEYLDTPNFPNGNVIVPTLLFWLAAVLALLAVVVTVVFLFKKSTRLPLYAKVFFGGYWAFAMYYFYLFCYLYPNTCTQNFRYIQPLMVVGVVQYAMTFDELEGGKETLLKKIFVRGLTAALAAFGLLSIAVYLLVGRSA